MKKILLILCCILTLISCARTVDTAEEDLFIELTINLNNTATSDSTVTPIYTIIFSPTENIQPSNPTKDDYYIFPGKSYAQETLDINNKTINSYYADNFSTWEQFIYISNIVHQLLIPILIGSKMFFSLVVAPNTFINLNATYGFS